MGDKDDLKQIFQDLFKEMFMEIVALVVAALSTRSGSGTPDTGAKKGATEDLSYSLLQRQ